MVARSRASGVSGVALCPPFWSLPVAGLVSCMDGRVSGLAGVRPPGGGAHAEPLAHASSRAASRPGKSLRSVPNGYARFLHGAENVGGKFFSAFDERCCFLGGCCGDTLGDDGFQLSA